MFQRKIVFQQTANDRQRLNFRQRPFDWIKVCGGAATTERDNNQTEAQ
jgi:hypothetical protein